MGSEIKMACSQYTKIQTVSVEVLQNIVGYTWEEIARLKVEEVI